MYKPLPTLPPSLRLLHFTSDYCLFNHPIQLPSSLTSLHFGEYFNQKIDPLPPSLISLSFGKYFNQQLHLPPSLTELAFPEASSFNQPLSLPPSLSTLIIENNSNFNQPLLSLPSSLTSLIILGNFNHPLPYLPLSLQELCLGRAYNQIWYNSPLKVDLSTFNHPLPSLPSTLSSLCLLGQFNHPLPPLPSSLKELHLGRSFNHPLRNLPNSLEVLIIENDYYDQRIRQLPVSLLKSHIHRQLNIPPTKYGLLIGIYLFFFVIKPNLFLSFVNSIGKNGTRLKEIESLGVVMKVPKKGEEEDNVKLSGSLPCVMAAEDRINDILFQARRYDKKYG